MDALSKLLRESFEYQMTDVHTAMPGVVVRYDPKTRRAEIQPSLKRKMPNGEYMDFPVIPEVPVLFFGSKRLSFHFPLERNDEVLLIFSERGTDEWKATGGAGIEEPDPRRFDLQDCFAIPGLKSQEFVIADKPGLQITLKDKFNGEIISQLFMADNQVELKHKKTIVDLKDGLLSATNDEASVKLSKDKISVKNGSKSLHNILTTLWNAMSTITPTTLGSPAQHNWNPAISQAIGTAISDLGSLMED